MVVVNTGREAKASLSELIEKVLAGQDVIIQPVAILSAYHQPKNNRKPGALRGQIRMSSDFDTLPPDIAGAFGAEPK